ncbi:beta-glucosidase-like glycosyl hydrolase [Kribbella sp. VKM Ac-2527]|uniref:Beta-glucosidase-like glycosyl hydrolase n=1 Tax=Kribbella caucasensis TaxID=2512215 RepID=A0A4R6KJZ9_9ACTN|nr:glycoside hydrolase family 3 C-terminal domain-containing protein [Kribbella sp. VKM Ac-2527]TDO51644.1 beta-glucosidase-like glycosyl hydrolase [Kribbella sp. VKM Ac-2527]
MSRDVTFPSNMYGKSVEEVRAGAVAEVVAAGLYAELTDAERLGLLDGDQEFWPGMQEFFEEGYNLRPIVHGAVPRLGIPGLRFSDGPRGVVMGNSTAFPVSMARGATWDVGLEERIGEVIGAEARAQGANFFGGVCINLPRHPAWGRAQETYGEDPVVLGEFGAALTRGVQRHVMACAKHYALNSMENARFSVDVTCDDATLHEVYLPHFRRVVEEGVSAVMSAYNSVNGEWCGQNEPLLTGVLRDQWGFRGVVVSDFVWGLRDAVLSLRAGLDVEEPFRQQRAQLLASALVEGQASWSDVERAGVRILATQLRHAASVDATAPARDVVASAEHRALAREAAALSMVLLRNEPVDGAPVLPLSAADLGSIAVIGRLADEPGTGDHGSSDVRAPEVVTALEGLRAALPGVDIRHTAADDPAEAAALAAACDVAVIVAGFTAEDEGEFVDPEAFGRPELRALYPPAADPELAERLVGAPAADQKSLVGSGNVGGDRARLTLRPVDEDIIRACAAANPRTVVAVRAAGAVLMEAWRESVPGVLMAWYSGMEGGHALADVLLGNVDATGRLPFSIPTDEAHLPAFDPDATAITYDRWFGQRLLDRLGVQAAYPLGFGLSYTTFALDGADAEVDQAETLRVTTTVRNTGDRPGRHVAQVYGVRLDGDRAGERALLGFTPVHLQPGASQTITITASLRPLGRWTPDTQQLRIPAGPIRIEVAAWSGDPARQRTELTLPEL